MADALTAGARGGGITLLAQAVKLIVQFASVVTLSRLLSPEDFGLIAMVAAFVALGELIRDFGTSVVGLGRQHLSHQQASNLFWMSSMLGVSAATALAFCGPLLTWLYKEPRLTEVVPVLAIGLALNGMSAQLGVQLARTMQYWKLFVTDVLPLIAGLAAAITGALMGLDYWALVAQVLTIAVVGLATRLALSDWRPSWPRRGAQNKALLKDSTGFGLAHLVQYISQNLDTVLIGARWDAAALGGYNRAFQLLTMPSRQMVAPLTRVVVPTVHKALKEGRNADEILLRVQFGIGLAVNWVYAITAGIASWLIPFVLGDGWDSVVPIFQILAVGGAVWVFSTVSYWAFIIGNLGKHLLYYNLVTKGLTSILIAIASLISIEAIAWAVSIGLVIAWPINLIWLAKVTNQPSMAYFRRGSTILLAAAVAFTTSWSGMHFFAQWPAWLSAIASALAGTVAYLSVIAALPGGHKELLSALAVLKRAATRK